MSDVKHYEYLFLGGGKGGKTLAMDMARQGRRVALIERGMIGGSCINVACIPSKTLIQNARQVHGWREAAGDASIMADMANVSENVRGVVDGMIKINRAAFEKSGLDLITGTGRFIAPRTISVRTEDGSEAIYEGENVYINTGTVAQIPNGAAPRI